VEPAAELLISTWEDLPGPGVVRIDVPLYFKIL
jgi:hypothetical protein